MAKENKEKNATLSEENVVDVIKKGNLIDEEVIKIGDEKDTKEELDRKVSEYRKAKNKAKYRNYKALLELRARRREEKITKEELAESKTNFDDLCAGKITPSEYEEKLRASAKKRVKAMEESNDQLSKELKELRSQFPGYWCWEWEDRW